MKSRSSLRCALRVSATLMVAGIIVVASGCGNSSNSLPQNLGGNYSAASLNGQYVISQTGIGIDQPPLAGVDPFSETIVFTADGAKNITVLVDDFNQAGQTFEDTNLAGNYTINKDGTGTISFNGFDFAITMIDDKHFYVIQQDVFATSSGFGEAQDTTAFSAAPSGTFVFKGHDELNTYSRVGGITIASGAISGTEDFLSAGVLSISKLVASSVSMTTPDANGRGTFALTDGTSFNYYVVGSAKFYLMSNSAAGSLEIGQAEQQTGAFSLATLASGNSYVFGSAGDSNVSGQAGIHSAGVFSTDGVGNITADGTVDYVQDATVHSDVAVSGGNYTLNSSGRGQINLTLTGDVISPQIFWMVNPNRAYFLMNNTTAVEDGIFTLQQGAPFNAVASQAAFVMDGFDIAFKDRVGAFQPTGNNLKWNQAANSFDASTGIGTPSSTNAPFTGTLQVSSNGRVAVVVNNVTPSLVFYLSSSSSGVMVQEDANIGGSFTVQAGQ